MKRKRVKVVARRSRTPRTRPQPRSQPTQTPSSPKSSKPSRKSARIAFSSTPRTSKPSAPVIEEISSSSSSLSGSDFEDPSFKQGTPCSQNLLMNKTLQYQPLPLNPQPQKHLSRGNRKQPLCPELHPLFLKSKRQN